MKEAGAKGTISPQICCHSTLQNLSALLYDCAFILTT